MLNTLHRWPLALVLDFLHNIGQLLRRGQCDSQHKASKRVGHLGQALSSGVSSDKKA